jgi:hypothetical protein
MDPQQTASRTCTKDIGMWQEVLKWTNSLLQNLHCEISRQHYGVGLLHRPAQCMLF